MHKLGTLNPVRKPFLSFLSQSLSSPPLPSKAITDLAFFRVGH